MTKTGRTVAALVVAALLALAFAVATTVHDGEYMLTDNDNEEYALILDNGAEEY
ncbi:MAG: hypothetical protein M3P49_04525 [Actinomycetota bacterium]|nr:hypothetical protein [Actinomycetota bacterium]